MFDLLALYSKTLHWKTGSRYSLLLACHFRTGAATENSKLSTPVLFMSFIAAFHAIAAFIQQFRFTIAFGYKPVPADTLFYEVVHG